jgi:hypothetical protein
MISVKKPFWLRVVSLLGVAFASASLLASQSGAACRYQGSSGGRKGSNLGLSHVKAKLAIEPITDIEPLKRSLFHRQCLSSLQVSCI